MKILKEFKDFVTQGNLIDLAVAFIIAVAFGAVLKGLVDFLIMPLIAAIFGQTSFDSADRHHQRRGHPLRVVPDGCW